ncbi:hypothetical protein MAM1_0286c09254 [Mucor ambiguus]|uniref:Uncharacterized protein n=1 Tax=Mucor ambiguus TaxID=91626 RepID=A0A0C9N1A7_9FUNG|nr:hypothetical protein MAM1_0286c09254 [Mucor ambiguus]
MGAADQKMFGIFNFIANTYRNRFFNGAKILEDDILVKIWVIVDQVINSYELQAKSGLELGCGEAGLDGEEFGTKVIAESSLKTPKLMHDMFVRLCGSVENKQEIIKKLQVVGLVFSRFSMRMLVMDCPNGYIRRLRGTTTAIFSGNEEYLGSDFRKAYQLIWKAKEVCKETEINFEFYDDSDDDKVYLPDSLRSPQRH